MKNSHKVIFTVLFGTLLVVSCSRKKDKFISRNFHALTTEYNILFNGYNALAEGRQALNESYTDNYWDILPIERMEIHDEIIMEGQSKNENFNRAEEKAAKAIQKHSMNIDGKEKNPQMDEAYLLLGKARYFDQRFVPALQAFNYILYKYPASDKINEAKIWREKTNIRLENDELAIKNLKRLLEQEELKDQDMADATSMLAQAYLNTKSVDSAITQLEIAAHFTKSNEERGRYHFIQGQLYNGLGKKDSANIAFDKVIALNRKTPRIYMITARLEKIRNFDYVNGNTLELEEKLQKLADNRENRPFLDKIYNEMGMYYLQNQSDSLATVYYNKSLRTNSEDKQLKAVNYEILGHMNFEKTRYETAGKYYDSTMNNMVVDSKPYRTIKRKRENLDDVIYYEAIASTNDSILNLVNLSETDKRAYFEDFIETLKVKAEAEKQKAALNEALKLNSGGVVTNNIGNKTSNSNKKKEADVFYFYNPTTVAYGKTAFLKTWGNRKLEDNWRSLNKTKASKGNQDLSPEVVLDTVSNQEKYDPQYYISKIPSEEKEIDSISKERNYAYYQLGLIYKEKFKEYELAKNKFENVLNSHPEEKLVLPSKYNLYKIYDVLGDHSAAIETKNDIIKSYPESRYASLLEHPESVVENNKNSPEALYEALYKQFENQEYEAVIAKSKAYIKTFNEEPMVPKFELLKATAIGRLNGYDAYKEAIKTLALDYANTYEGQQAKSIETELLPKMGSTDFIDDKENSADHYKVVFQFKNSERDQIPQFQKNLDAAFKNIDKYYDLKSSVDVYSPDTIFVVVHGLNNAQFAKTFDQLLTSNNKQNIYKPYFTISSENYKVIQTHKNLDAYLSQNNN